LQHIPQAAHRRVAEAPVFVIAAEVCDILALRRAKAADWRRRPRRPKGRSNAALLSLRVNHDHAIDLDGRNY